MQLFVEHLTVIDSAYLDPEHGIVGESWIVDVTLHGDLDPQSMVMDFGHVKKQLKAAIDDSVDHTLIAPAKSPNLTVTHGEQLTLTYQFGDGESLEHGSPANAVTLLDAEEVTDEALVAWLETYVMHAESLEDGTHRATSNDTGTGRSRTQHHAACAVVTFYIVVQGARFTQRHADHRFASAFGRFLNSVLNFFGFAGAVTDLAFTIAHYDECCEGEATTALNRFSNAVDRHETIDVLAAFALLFATAVVAVTTTVITVATAVVAVAAAVIALALGLLLLGCL